MTTLKDYPYWPSETLDDVKTQMRQIANIRKDDIAQINALPGIFVGGRLVGKLPATSTDIAATDRLNDVSRDDMNTYVVQVTGAPGVLQWIKYEGVTF